MSAFAELREGVTSQVNRVVRMAQRATAGPMLVRLTVLLAALAGFAIAYPPRVVFAPGALVFVVFAILPALFPRGPWPSFAIGAIVFGWLIATSFGSITITTWRLAVVAALLYIVHVGAAFAAVLPYDAVVTRGLFLPWIRRAGAVIVLGAVLSVAVLALPSVVGTHRLVAATIVGFALVLSIAGYLAYLGKRA